MIRFPLSSIAVVYLTILSLVFRTAQCETGTENDSWHSNLSLVIHRNGEVDPCGTTEVGSVDSEFVESLSTAKNKYDMETLLTDNIARALENGSSKSRCGRETDSNDSNYEYEYLYIHCDRGPEKTPILLDHEELVSTAVDTLPCRFYTREGLRIQNVEQLKRLTEKAKLIPSQSCANPQGGDDACETPEIHLYAVPAGRVFLFAPAYIGETFELDHLSLLPDETQPIVLKVLSTSPKVFDILHVFTEEEAAEVVKRALAETSPSHKIKRSTTGTTTQGNIFNKRTSENGFDTHGQVALALKKRIFEVLGYDEYWNGHDDGLQVLRYNLTKAYTPHMDYLPTNSKSSFDYRSHRKGGNRYATVLLYMTDIPEGGGGETVFAKVWPEGENQSQEDALKELRASGDAERAGIEQGSWEEEMVATCRSRLSIRPHAGRAILFYSQLPNGEEDQMSLHGGCPVLTGDKWAANLWVWNTPREDFEGAPTRDDLTAEQVKGLNKKRVNPQLHAIFTNSGTDPSMKNAELYYDEAMFWGKLGHGDENLAANTYEGHRWNIKVDGKVVKTWVISAAEQQVFRI